jgi:hypothetical protein
MAEVERQWLLAGLCIGKMPLFTAETPIATVLTLLPVFFSLDESRRIFLNYLLNLIGSVPK